MSFDVIVVGGSYAGLSAALQLARARQRVAVVDAGQRRNRFVATSHGFLGQDGRVPGDIVRDARAQLLAYPNVSWVDGQAAAASGEKEAFEVQVAGRPLQGRRLVLATGIADELPAVDGLQERWGRTVFHCPYCHGYELSQGAIGVLASSALAMHHALMLPDWGRVTLFLNGSFEPDDGQARALAARGVSVEAVPIQRISGEATVETGRRPPRRVGRPVHGHAHAHGQPAGRATGLRVRRRACRAVPSAHDDGDDGAGRVLPAATRRWPSATWPCRWATARWPGRPRTGR